MNFLKLLKIEASIAFRYLQSRNKEKFISVNSFFSFFGITIGVAALIVVMSIMNGFREELTNKIIGLNSDVVINEFGNHPIKNWKQKIVKISKLKEVRHAFGVIQKQGLITHKNTASGVIIKAISSKSLSKQTLISQSLNNTTIKNFKGDHILIGSAMANKMRLRIGQTISLLSPEFKTTFFGNKVPKTKDFVISGIFRTGLTEYDETTAFIPIDAGQSFYGFENSVNQIEVSAYNHQEAPQLAMLIYHIFNGNLLVNDWQKINFSLFNALKTERVAMFSILTLIIIVAAFNIVSSLTMLVIDKSKEIAILKTIGMMKISIIRIFFFCGFIISVLASITGVALGLGISYNIQTIKEYLSSLTGTDLFDPVVYYLDALPSKVDPNDIQNIVILVAIATLVATIYPAWKAGRLNPVDILKSE